MSLLERYKYTQSGIWFGASATQCQRGEENETEITFQMMKVAYATNKIVLSSEEVVEHFVRRDHELLFHGTKQPRSADDILRNGITLGCGGTRHDFSDGNGFYLSDDFEAAQEWSLKVEHLPRAVLIYCVPNSLLRFGKKKGLDLSKNKDLWARVVRYHRSSGKVEQHLLEGVGLNKRSFIKGPVSMNGEPQSPTPLEINNRKFQQYCIRSEKLAYTLSYRVVGVVIYTN